MMTNKACYFVWLGALALVIAGGCGSSTGDVSGTVTFQENPVDFGSIAFIGENGTSVSGNIQKGVYRLAKIPVGPVKVAVTSTPQLVRGMVGLEGTPPPSETKFVPTPARYKDPDQSGLTYKVVAGHQTYNVPLTP